MGGAWGATTPPSPPFRHSWTKVRPEGPKKFWRRPLPPSPPNLAKIMVLILHEELESKLERVRIV